MSHRESLRARVSGHAGAVTLDVDLDTAPGTLVVVGPNGAGKTSLLSLILGVFPVLRGHIAVGDTVLFDEAANIDVPLEDRRFGYVPQDYALFPHLSVRENVEFALASARSALNRHERARRVDAVLTDLGLDNVSARRPQTLSGGEQQRVALARALSIGPRALLLDEPLSALDVHARREVRAFLGQYLRKVGLPTLIVTHDAADARELGDGIAVLEAGSVTQRGTWTELANDPRTRFVEEFVGSVA